MYKSNTVTALSLLSLLPGNDAESKESKREEKEEEEEETEGGKTKERDMIPALPLQLIQRNRLTTDQIRLLPRFKNYSPGEPSSVRPHPFTAGWIKTNYPNRSST